MTVAATPAPPAFGTKGFDAITLLSSTNQPIATEYLPFGVVNQNDTTTFPAKSGLTNFTTISESIGKSTSDIFTFAQSTYKGTSSVNSNNGIMTVVVYLDDSCQIVADGFTLELNTCVSASGKTIRGSYMALYNTKCKTITALICDDSKCRDCDVVTLKNKSLKPKSCLKQDNKLISKDMPFSSFEFMLHQ